MEGVTQVLTGCQHLTMELYSDRGVLDRKVCSQEGGGENRGIIKHPSP